MGSKEDAATIGLIGSIVQNMKTYEGNFLHERDDCPFHEPIMSRCTHGGNPTISCEWDQCPLDNPAELLDRNSLKVIT